MPHLSFSKSKSATPIAIVKGGDYDKEILYLNPDDKNETKPKKEINAMNYMKDLKSLGLKPHQRTMMINKFQEAMYKGIPPEMLLENENIQNISEFIPGFEAQGWIQIVAPNGVDIHISDRINLEVNSIIHSPEITKKLVDLGTIPSNQNVSQSGTFVSDEVRKVKKILDEINLKQD
jgi:hypothetical protein